jgi:dihydrofolate reductase
MQKLVAIEFTTLDGVMQGLGSPDEDTEGGFEWGGWGARYAEALTGAASPDLSSTTAYLFGRKTYEKMAAYWPYQGNENPIAAHLNSTRKFVASTTLTSAPWGNETAEILSQDLAREVVALKHQQRGSIAILGSGVMVDTLLRLALIDELRLYVHPLLLGTGKKLFRGLPAPRDLKLLSSATTALGTLALTYALH